METSKLIIDHSMIINDWESEKEVREKNKNNRMSFGIGFLDQAFRGILPTDVVLIGARTGVGKTSLVTNLCTNFSKQGKKVTFFALEASDKEIAQRIKYSILTDLFFSDPNRERSNVSFPDFLNRDLDSIFAKYEQDAKSIYEDRVKNIRVVYKKSSSFTIKDLETQMTAFESDTDIFVIDHIHYIDIESANENRELSNITKRIRDLALVSGKPVVVIAHLRKKSNIFDGSLVDSIDDFHGSSDLVKIATKVFMMGRASDFDSKEGSGLGTIFTIPKFRQDGSVTRFAAIVMFSVKRDSYLKPFKLGRIEYEKGKQKFVEIVDKSEAPYWAHGQGKYV